MHPDLSLLSVLEHQHALQAEAHRGRLAALARCCRESALRAALSTGRAALDALRPARRAACCA